MTKELKLIAFFQILKWTVTKHLLHSRLKETKKFSSHKNIMIIEDNLVYQNKPKPIKEHPSRECSNYITVQSTQA